MKHFVWIFAIVLLLLSTAGCGLHHPGKQDKWKPYTVRMEDEARALRKSAGLQGRTAYTVADSLGNLKVVGVDSFDTEGYMVFSRVYSREGKVLKELRFDYSNGNLNHSSQLDERGVIHIYYQHDDKGNKTFEYVLASPTDTMLTRRYKYDKEGREIEAWFWRMENNYKAQKQTQYDDRGRPTKLKEFEGDLLNWQEEYHYDGEAKLTAERFDGSGVLQKRFEMDFDSLGHCRRMEQFNGTGVSKVKVMYTYDASGKLMKEETYGGKDLSEMTEYTYDERGMTASRKVFAYGTVTEIRYTNRYR